MNRLTGLYGLLIGACLLYLGYGRGNLPFASARPDGPGGEGLPQGGLARTVRVPILMYHYIRINPKASDRVGADLSVTPAHFAEQMQWLADNGFHTISLDDLTAAILYDAILPSHPVILTFDDGYEDLYTAAYPILLEHHFKATSFVITGKVGWAGYLSWDEMHKMLSGGLVQFESHTVHHVQMGSISLVRAHNELVQSKRALENALGVPVRYFCYPSGSYNPQVERLVAIDGYVAAVTTRYGATHTGANLEALSRVRINGVDDLQIFARKLGVKTGNASRSGSASNRSGGRSSRAPSPGALSI